MEACPYTPLSANEISDTSNVAVNHIPLMLTTYNGIFQLFIC